MVCATLWDLLQLNCREGDSATPEAGAQVGPTQPFASVHVTAAQESGGRLVILLVNEGQHEPEGKSPIPTAALRLQD